MAKKPPEPTNEQLLDRLLNGGPRQRRDAGAALRRRACAGEQLASLMPDPGSLSDPAQRYYVLGILSLHYCKEDQFEAYVGLLRHQHLGSALLDWGNFVHTRAPQFIPRLMPLVIEHLASDDAERVKAAGYPIAQWGQKGVNLWAWADQLLPLLGKEDRVVWGLVHAFEKAEVKPSLEAVLPLVESRDAKLRAGASALLAHIAMGQQESSRLLALLAHSNASVRRGAATAVAASSQRIGAARQLMSLTIGLEDRRAREAIASAVTAGLESRLKMSAEVKEARKQLQSTEAADRVVAAERVQGLIIDMVDCRGLATLLAAALFDEVQEVRSAAGAALSYVAEMQAPVYVVQATLPCIQAAKEMAGGEFAEQLQRASDYLMQAQSDTPKHMR